MKTKIHFLLPALVAACLQGCMHTSPEWDRQFGTATRANLAAQVLDPAAAANRNPATGIDGRAAKGVHDRYQRSFAQPESAPPPIFLTTGGAR
jgi:type IV pilus biogenesis protein CpaD/CtpE